MFSHPKLVLFVLSIVNLLVAVLSLGADTGAAPPLSAGAHTSDAGDRGEQKSVEECVDLRDAGSRELIHGVGHGNKHRSI